MNVHFLMARHTLDEHIWRMIARKLSLVSRALDGKVPLSFFFFFFITLEPRVE